MSGAAARNFMIIGQCIAHETKNAAKVRVKKLQFDERLHMYFAKHTNFYAHDPDKQCKVGDIVLIKALPEKMTRFISHSLVKVVYPYGDVTDPITGKKCVVSSYRENIEKRNEMFGVAEEGAGGFDYTEAPERGWQEGKKDFTHKVGYKKWHEFEPGHPLYNDPVAS
ncbi:28S ribosomal protein S17, mitochondrial-like [Penaeus japonicus]|uniref:28S ribosomal protein S17, mitochondrial-like n=1 Tax=Penaeus japonicus TaxID=27405 RepID=UPI001C7114DB|nr:28S ribosomal protein S17, mitochondrial-like [Penaeus japonicus]